MNDKPTLSGPAVTALIISTAAFSLCFASWVLNSVLVVHLVDTGVYAFDKTQVGWLLGAPLLSGALSRIPLGMLTDRYGGRTVFTLLLLVVAGFMLLLSRAEGYTGMLTASLGFGLAGGGFAVGIGYLPAWFDRRYQGTVLGIFGLGNAGAAATTLLAPLLLNALTDQGGDPEAWRQVPRIYAILLIVAAGVFRAAAPERVLAHKPRQRFSDHLRLLRDGEVWRLGGQYALVFGGFVALTQWLVPYGINVYELSIAEAGLLATVFGLPSGIIRVVGGWLSDRYGAKPVMAWVYTLSVLVCAVLSIPKMNIETAGEGLLAAAAGTVEYVSSERIVVDAREYRLKRAPVAAARDDSTRILPRIRQWQEPAVRAGERVAQNDLLARGVTHVHYPAQWWTVVALVFVFGLATGMGKAGVYKLVADHYPDAVGAVGGIVAMLGGLGGFAFSLCFAELLESTGLWSSCWMALALLSFVCLRWVRQPVCQVVSIAATASERPLQPASPRLSLRAPAPPQSLPSPRWSRRRGNDHPGVATC